MPEPPEATETLRQGDLLIDLVLPKLTWPLAYARAPDAVISADQPIVLPSGKVQIYLVVSQCCTIANRGVVALGKVRNTAPLRLDQMQAYEREVPTDDPEATFAFNEHPLQPVGGYLQRSQNQIYVADFTSIQSYSGRIEQFQASRVAAMSPEGRRGLRIRLAAFWSRVEGEDEELLTERGISPGFKLEVEAPVTAVPDPAVTGARCTR